MLVCWTALALLSIGAEPTTAIDAIVVRPAAWSPAVQAWKQHRQKQGLNVVEIDAELGRVGIHSAVTLISRQPSSRLKYLLLAGDVVSEKTTTDKTVRMLVPTWYQNSTAMVQFGGDPEIGTDNPYADLDGDQNPELAVGRIPADTPEELESILDRTIRYEQHGHNGAWRRNVHVVAGVGGFGAVADSVIEMTTRRFLTDRVPGWAEITMTHASPTSPYCPDPWRFGESTINRMNEGGTFWVYVGHGHVKTLDYLKVDEQFIEIMTNAQVPMVDVGNRPPIAVFLACYTGAFDAQEDCLAEQLLKHSTGPVAAIAGSRVTGPYGMSMLSSGMLAACYDLQTDRLGDVVLHAKREMLKPDQALSQSVSTGSNARSTQMQLISSLATALSPEGHDLAAERLEHVWEMNLLGDPMLRLSHPQTVELKLPERVQPGQEILVTGTSPIAGRLQIELALRRDMLPKGLKTAAAFSSVESERNARQECYLAANQRVVRQREQVIPVGKFECLLVAPEDISPGRYCVRAFLEGSDTWATGYATIIILAKHKIVK